MRMVKSTTKSLRAFTLVELLVVIAIIGILVSLLLPAVQAARESGRRMQCQNNLKQMGIAVQTYHDSYKAMPSGSTGGSGTPWCDPRVGCGIPGGHFGWPALILPFMEQQGLFDSINFTVPAYAESIVEGNPVTTVKLNQLQEFGPHGDVKNRDSSRMCPPSFVCPSAHQIKKTRVFKDYGINNDSDGSCCPERTQANMDGVAFLRSKVPLAEVTDGTSNTFLVLEYAHFGNHSWIPLNAGSNLFMYVHHTSEGYVDGGSPPNLFNRAVNNNTRGSHSDHPGGVQSVFVDGHVGFISDHIDMTAYRAQFSRNKGEAVSAN
jgi:prepilin-type N-terminal cleavage/methylation domain-containing protein/prepilin-type processing-associated H-X9-DG protein